MLKFHLTVWFIKCTRDSGTFVIFPFGRYSPIVCICTPLLNSDIFQYTISYPKLGSPSLLKKIRVVPTVKFTLWISERSCGNNMNINQPRHLLKLYKIQRIKRTFKGVCVGLFPCWKWWLAQSYTVKTLPIKWEIIKTLHTKTGQAVTVILYFKPRSSTPGPSIILWHKKLGKCLKLINSKTATITTKQLKNIFPVPLMLWIWSYVHNDGRHT